MLKRTFFKICFYVLILSFCFIFTLPAKSENSCDDDITISTVPGNADNSSMHPPLKFDPANPEEITCGPGNAITITVIDGYAPFIWENLSDGYSWVNGENVHGDPGSKQTSTRSNQLQCNTGT